MTSIQGIPNQHLPHQADTNDKSNERYCQILFWMLLRGQQGFDSLLQNLLYFKWGYFCLRA